MASPKLRQHVLLQQQTALPLCPRGNHGKVYKVTDLNGDELALKISEFRDATEKEERYLMDEVVILSRLNHPNVLSFIAGWENRSENGQLHMYLLTEFCTGRDLRTYLNNVLGEPPREETFASWLAQIASGLKYIHECMILHRNLKTSNIMVDNHDARGVTIKIGDFGMSKVLNQHEEMANSVVGTPYFMSPELLNSQPYNSKTDIWSLGCTAYEIATLTIIFEAKTLTTLMSMVEKNRVDTLTKDMKYGAFVKGLLCRMLEHNPDLRPTAGEILNILASENYSTISASSSSSGGSQPCSMLVRENVSNPHWDMSMLTNSAPPPEVTYGDFVDNNNPEVGGTFSTDLAEALRDFSQSRKSQRLLESGSVDSVTFDQAGAGSKDRRSQSEET